MVNDKLAEFEEFRQKVAACKAPEQLFGEVPGESWGERLDKLKKEYHRLLFIYHPAANKEESEELLGVAGEITNIVIYLFSLAEKKMIFRAYGIPDPERSENLLFEPLITRSHEYVISRLLAEGDNSLVYAARMDGAKGDNVCLKIAKEATANERLLVEKEVLENVRHYQVPKLLDAFKTENGLMVLVEQLIDGLDLLSLLALPRYQNGIPEEHMAWIVDRCLFTIGEIHTLGRLHGNITPAHLVVSPRDHRVYFVGFGESVKKAGGRYGFKAEIYGAPEIARNQPLRTQSDLYALGKCLIFAFGGDLTTNLLPESVNSKIAEFLAGLVCVDPDFREGDAWGAWYRWSDLRQELFGARHSFEYFPVD